MSTSELGSMASIEALERVLQQPPLDITSALTEAIIAGRMSVEEAAECLGDYERVFG